MENLMVFEGNDVKVIEINGYSVVKTTITKKGQDWLIKKCDKWNLLEIAN